MVQVSPRSESYAQFDHGSFSVPQIVINREGRVICENDALHKLREHCDQAVWHRLRKDLELHIAIAEVLSGDLPSFHSRVEFILLGEAYGFDVQILPVEAKQGGILGVQIEIATNERSCSG